MGAGWTINRVFTGHSIIPTIPSGPAINLYPLDDLDRVQSRVRAPAPRHRDHALDHQHVHEQPVLSEQQQQWRDSASTAGSFDPNSMLGPSGYGPSNFVSGAAQARFPYQIEFENSPSATAPRSRS